MAKAKGPDEGKLQEGLLKLLDGQQMRLTASGKTPGVFPGAKAGELLVRHALDQGLVEECEPPPSPAPAGKSKKAVPPGRFARLTSVGREWLLKRVSPREAIEALGKILDRQCAEFRSPDSEAGVLQALLADLQSTVNNLQRQVSEAISRRRDDSARITASIQSLSAAVQQAAAKDPFKAATAPACPPLPVDVPAVAFVREWEQRTGAHCPFHELFSHLRAASPALSIGAFHDTLRALHEGGRLRLSVWSAPPDRMKEPELGLFISSTLMYYAHAPDARG